MKRLPKVSENMCSKRVSLTKTTKILSKIKKPDVSYNENNKK